MLHIVDWYLVSHVLGQPVGPVFIGQAVQDYGLALKDGTERMSQNVGH